MPSAKKMCVGSSVKQNIMRNKDKISTSADTIVINVASVNVTGTNYMEIL